LIHIRDNFEVGQAFPSQFIVYGPPGSGKSAMIRALLREMNDSSGIDSGNASKWILQVKTFSLSRF
jgi:Cdc6-like AAA superfamily ATPase